jgi:hypothetical protein
MFIKFYLQYIASRRDCALFRRGVLGYYLELFFHVGMGVLIFYLTQVLQVWVWVGWVFLGYAVLQAYAWLIDDPVRKYRQPLKLLNGRAGLKQYEVVCAAIGRFCADVKSGGGKPTRAAGALVDAIIVYYALCHATGLGAFSLIYDQLKKEATRIGIAPVVLVAEECKGIPVPGSFSINTLLKNGETFIFERKIVA